MNQAELLANLKLLNYYLVTGSPARGPRGWFGSDYEESLNTIRAGVEIPCIGHEIGQYCAYSDFSIIEKFNGKGRYSAFPEGIGWGKVPYMHPGNYIIMRDSAKTHGLLPQNKALAHASGKFQVACYKEEIEALLRTKTYSGYELLDLHDYLGQGGALIGLLNAFWEEKGYVPPMNLNALIIAQLRLSGSKNAFLQTSKHLPQVPK